MKSSATTASYLKQLNLPFTPPRMLRCAFAAAPGLLDQEHTVVREQGESDERYLSRCNLLAALLDYAKNQD